MLQICCKIVKKRKKEKKAGPEKECSVLSLSKKARTSFEHPSIWFNKKEKRKPTLAKARKISFKDASPPFGGDYPREGTWRFVPGLRSLPPVIRGSQHRNKRRDSPHGNGYTMTSIIASNYRRVDRARHASIVSYAWPRSWQRSQNSKRNAYIRITFSNEVPRGGGAGGGRKGSRPVQPPPFYENCTARFQLPRAFSRNMLLPSRD